MGHAPLAGFFVWGWGGDLKPYQKPALTYEQQLALLESRGLAISDRKRALDVLARISYYRLSAYWFPFRKTDATGRALDQFDADATFDEAVWLYEFDRRLRLIALDAIERVEVLLRTSATYALVHSFGPFAHADPKNFAPKFQHAGWYANVTEEIERAKERFLDHFRKTYAGFPRVPLWMASEVMSLGTLSKMFKGLATREQAAIVGPWGVQRPVAESWLHTLTYVRNACAHHARLWNRELAIKPMIPRNLSHWASVSNRRVYSVLCVLRQLTRPAHASEDWAAAARALLRELDAKPRWRNAMGVPLGWANQWFWEKPPTSTARP